MKQTQHSIDVIAGLLLFLVFTGAMLMVLVSGAGAYQKISRSLERQYGQRTCLSYIAAKIRHYDTEEGVYLTDFEGLEALALDEEIEGDTYTTLLYYQEGYLWELFSLKDAGLGPEDGLAIMPVQEVSFREAGSLLRITCREADEDKALLLSPRSGKEGGTA